jgi:lambda repressor-like predicted transcriptional regulator
MWVRNNSAKNPSKSCLDMLERGIGRFVSEFPEPKHAGGRPRGSRDKVRRKPRGLASPPESNDGGELSFRAPEPAYEVERERGWHTLAAHLYATGATGTQLAREFGKDRDTVYNLLRQPWFMERVNQIVAERGADAMELLRGAQTTAIQTVIAILNDPMVPARVRLMAADSIIDRVAGKATQRIEAVGAASSSDPVAEVARLEQEMEQAGWVQTRQLPPLSNGQSESSPRSGDKERPSVPLAGPESQEEPRASESRYGPAERMPEHVVPLATR